MKKSRKKALPDQYYQDLWKAILTLKTPEECQRFFLDLCTPGELQDMAERWWIARLLDKGQLSYREIAEETGASTTTVGRVARFLTQEPHQGYQAVLKRIRRKNT
ncbi:MAG: YerC/YecD family TrpR-related protein [Pseudomonadota bacterium]|nr:YerC/YecD family TrpR-related protein [Pseudomonadota bacterium]